MADFDVNVNIHISKECIVITPGDEIIIEQL